MPTLTTRIDADVNFEVFCGICGIGCCDATDVDNKRNSITVTCPKCKLKIIDLENEIDILRERL